MAPLLTFPTLAGLGAPVDVGRDEARREAARELLRAGYARESVFDRAVRAVNQFIGDLTDQDSLGTVGSVTVRVVLVALVVAEIGRAHV